MDVIIGILGDSCELLLFGSRIVVCGKALARYFVDFIRECATQVTIYLIAVLIVGDGYISLVSINGSGWIDNRYRRRGMLGDDGFFQLIIDSDWCSGGVLGGEVGLPVVYRLVSLIKYIDNIPGIIKLCDCDSCLTLIDIVSRFCQ